MPSEWQYMLWVIVPIAAQTKIANIATRLMPDVREDLMFEGIRLSVSGSEPATHLMTVCPMTPRLAKRWKDLCLTSEDDRQDFPNDETPDATDVSDFSTWIQNARFISAITNRLNPDDSLIKSNWDVLLIDRTRFPNVTTIPSFEAVLSRVGLSRIEDVI